ncbi:hypothetical protein A1O3_06549 [Capronia epimyces CBS 606.96]|uniref:NACHT domain-containing protein n=1 Tax=Capronia epimyces CBS 606.96 TaxID=1182542 RepID=W9YKE0_9EURO|nr:uncharacterized protein A1O3_06549 [Capronia epimyces CBS 606.96]EXJ82734.1 hypothetical protein A1O3_06549 [Capronia epimyces CBS 606.96]
MSSRPSLQIDQYQVGVICALPHEMAAAMAILDEHHEQVADQDELDNNNYVLGKVHEHNVVIASLPAGVYGTVSAARVARDMVRTFTGLRFGLMLGIGGGVPTPQKDIRLGDVVISQPEQTHGGVVQYDLGKNLGDNHFERKGTLTTPPTMLLAALSRLQAEHEYADSKVPDLMAKIYQQRPKLTKNGYAFPGREKDILYCSRCGGSNSSNLCGLCADGKIARPAHEDANPAFWYGVIASGNELIRNAAARDRLSGELGALCVEMEAAGLMNDFPCIVIRGICDYADSHKNDAWQRYAALTAAAYAKELLTYIQPKQISREKAIREVVKSLVHEVKQGNEKQEQRYQSQQSRDCCQAFKTSTYERFKDVNPNRVEGTCQWVLSHPQYRQWDTTPHDDLLWISADPGCGKSVLAKSLVDNELRTTEDRTVCYFFFKDNEEQDNLGTALCALLHQLFSHQPHLIQYALPAWEKTGHRLAKEVPELWRILLAAAMADVARDVICVLDALDECRPSDWQWLIDMLAKFHEMSRSPSGTRRARLKFLVTSRPYDDIEARFQRTLNDLPTIRLRGEEENDQIHREIDLVIRKRVEELAKEATLEYRTKERLEVKLRQMENRTYLWLHLAIEDIRETLQHTLRPEQASFESLPSSVEDAYEKILSRVSKKKSNKEKRKILQIVVGAHRPLTIQEMAIALGIATRTHPISLHDSRLDPDRLKNNIRHWCGLFVFINHDRIYLIHQTAKEFLVYYDDATVPSSGWKHCLDPRGVEKEMTRICVEFLCFEDIRPRAQSLVQKLIKGYHHDIDDVSNKDEPVETLFAYSAEHWPRHVQDADLSKNDSLWTRISPLYDVNASVDALWFSIFWHMIKKSIWQFRSQGQPRMDSIHLAALLGHGQTLELTLQSNKHFDLNQPDSLGRTALIYACAFGHTKIVQILLDNGADVNAQGEDGISLQAASAYGHEEIVQILVDNGADVNAQGGYFKNALQAASAEGHERIVQILLDNGAEVNAQGEVFGNVILAASEVNAQGEVFGNALRAASARGHEKIVQMLLDNGAEVNAQGGEFGNALQAASAGGHEKIVQMLRDKGAVYHLSEEEEGVDEEDYDDEQGNTDEEEESIDKEDLNGDGGTK